MPVARFQLPDGRVARFEVPDGTTPEQAQGMMASYDFSQASQPKQAPGFFDRVGDRLDSRKQNMANMADEYVTGKQTMGETMLQHGGQGAAFAGDVFGEGLKSAGNALSYVTPDFIENPIKEAAGAGIDRALDSRLGRAAVSAANAAVQGYQNFAGEHPRAARNIEATINIGAGVLPIVPVKGASAAGAAQSVAEKGYGVAKEAIPVAGKAITSAKQRLSTVADALKKAPIPAADDLRGQASALYKQADELGGILKPEFTNSYLDDIGKELLPKKVAGREVPTGGNVREVIDFMGELRDQPLTLESAQNLDEYLGSVIDREIKEGRLTKEGTKLLNAQSSLREAIEKADEGLIEGGKEGFEALKKGRQLWAASRKMADVERIITRAEMTDNPATSIKTGFRTLLGNPKRMRGFTSDERKAIEKAAQTGIATDLLRIAGSRLNPIIAGAAAGPFPAAAAYGVSEAARRGATALQMGRAQDVARAVGARVPPPDPNKALADALMKRPKKD